MIPTKNPNGFEKINLKFKGKWSSWIKRDKKGKVLELYGRNFQIKKEDNGGKK